MSTPTNIVQMIERRRDDARDSAQRIADAAAAQNRGLSSVEQVEFDAYTAEVASLNKRLSEIGAENRDAASTAANTPAPAPTPGVGGAIVRSEPQTYTKGGTHSHVRDHMMRALGRADNSVHERLERHAREVAVETRAGSTADGAGGEFTPPLWVVNEYVGKNRAGRATADLARRLTLPSGTDSISVPQITTGTLTAVQATENTAATNRDMVTASTTAVVTTIAGYYDTSVQQVEQSALAGGWDQIVYSDLMRDYNRAQDYLVLYGTGADNQHVGIATAAFTSVTVATSAATALYAGIADGMNRISTDLFEAPEVIIMHPRRWFFLVSRYDADGRPLVTPDAQAGQNLLATMGVPAPQGVVGTMLGLPVVIDPNVSTTTSDYFDDVFIWRPSESILMEGAPRLEAFRSVLSDTLGVRFRLYAYSAFTARTSNAVAKLTGAGLTGPTW